MKLLVLVMVLAASGGVSGNEPVLKKVGEARLTFMFWPVYDARLYTADGSYSRGVRPVRPELEYLVDIESGELVKQTASEWESQGLTHQRQQEWLQSLSGLWPDVSASDVIVLELDAQDNSTFYLNGELLGSLQDEDFGQQFIDIWLSDNTTQPRLRRSLLGQAQ